MIVIPAIDLRAGKCVRLVQGKLSEETVFSDQPVEMAVTWEALGAPMLHLVDLDGAFAGEPRNLEVVQEIVRSINIPVQLGGGIRTVKAVSKLLEMGVSRVILGTAAIVKPRLVEEAVKEFGEQIVVGIDAKDGLVAIEGWESTVEKTTVELAQEMELLGVQRVVFTDTRRDGLMKGPNLDSTRELALAVKMKIIASGGVSCLDDIRALKQLEPLGVEGVVMGKALYTGAVRLEDALAVARE
ncbi:MAG: 1-(5-phosphoribosyl)-5-[(5-phosphoribosylamino)methylideneamino]imidazole-4-carboxamide isomerase [Firmicutes bacterium]|nr:1-(5-phosphoribosyl)-5-[(5-phosphoribosylamino)methylideneamino]imidazole-4-carboxamide isomerase [Bacillota bacterium]